MGFVLRKSLRAGPFRVNLSKSGIGVSAGVPGFRVGTGPRGSYVHVGRGGVYYRRSLSSPRTPAATPRTPPVVDPHSDVAMEDVTGATVMELAASSASELLDDLRTATERRAVWPWAALAAGVLVVLVGDVSPVLTTVVVVLGVLGTIWTYLWDRARRSVVVFYDVEDEAAERFDALVQLFEQVRRCDAVWHKTEQGDVTTTGQFKSSGGASAIVSRTPAKLTTQGPRVLVTNIAVPTLAAGSRSLSFLPDRVLVHEGRTVAEVAWDELVATSGSIQFIEDGPRPADSEQVGSTWRHVNVKGGPDRRYKDNPRLPIMLFGELELTSAAGLRSIWTFSQPQAAKALASTLTSMPTP